MKQLETSRLLLREWSLEDANDVYVYGKSKVVGPMAGWKPHDSVEESKEIIQMFQRENETWAIYLKEEKVVVGSVGLHKEEDARTKMLGYVLAEEYWGKGIVVEASKVVLQYAFETMGLDKVTVYHFPFNQQSKRVIEKLGFIYTGIREQNTTIFDGTVYDDICYCMTKEAYEELYGEKKVE